MVEVTPENIAVLLLVFLMITVVFGLVIWIELACREQDRSEGKAAHFLRICRCDWQARSCCYSSSGTR